MNVDKAIIDIVGLTASDFTRSVVLPQGKFSEFLQLDDSKRREMLERIFNLEKYGRSLTEKIKNKKIVFYNTMERHKKYLMKHIISLQSYKLYLEI